MTHSPDLTVLKVKMKMHQTRFLGSLLSHCFVSCVSRAHITNSSAAGVVVYVSVRFLSCEYYHRAAEETSPSSSTLPGIIIIVIILLDISENIVIIVIVDGIVLHLLQHLFTKKMIFFMNFPSSLILAVRFSEMKIDCNNYF